MKGALVWAHKQKSVDSEDWAYRGRGKKKKKETNNLSLLKENTSHQNVHANRNIKAHEEIQS